MAKPTLSIDFNEMIDNESCLLSKEDITTDIEGNTITLIEGLEIAVFMDDLDENGNVDPLIANGIVELNTSLGWSASVKWCIKIDAQGVQALSKLQKHHFLDTKKSSNERAKNKL